MEADHASRLKSLCRICEGFIRDDVKSYQTVTFAKEILEIYNIDVHTEKDDLFPSYVCSRHARLLYRYRETEGQSFVNSVELKSVNPKKTYLPHSETCIICDVNVPSCKPRGRPKKRRKTDCYDTTSYALQSDPESETGANPIPLSSQYEMESTNIDYHDYPDMTLILYYLKKRIPTLSEGEKQFYFDELLGLLSLDDLSILCNCIGKKQNGPILEDADTFHYLYKDVNSIAEFNTLKWLSERNSALTAYIMGLCNFDRNYQVLEDKSRETLLIARVVEQVYSICSRTLISPISFLLNLSAYSFTGSKVLVDMIGNANPSGQYKAITNWLKNQGGKPVAYPTGDVMNVFDNEQVIGKTWSIKPRNKIATSIITNKGFLKLSSENNLQARSDLKPERKMRLEIQGDGIEANEERLEKKAHFKKVISEIIDQESQRYIEMEKDHNEQLYHFINHAIQTVLSEQSYNGDRYEDCIDVQVAKEIVDENYIKCELCGTLNGKRKFVCTSCHSRDGLKMAKERRKEEDGSATKPEKKLTYRKIVFENDENEDGSTDVHSEFSLFSHIESNHEGRHELLLTDPVFCNPNSVSSVARVLRKIGEENGIFRYGGDKRHWTFVCCDGLPYMIIKKLKEEAVVCAIQKCGMSFLSLDRFESHADEVHANCPRKYIFEFDWLYIRIGAGHYEMNLLKSFFELNWIPILEMMCEVMGFQSESAKNFAKSCKDHHKSWRLLLVFHLGSLQELVLPYVRECLKLNKTPSAKDFLTFNTKKYSSASNPNFRYMMDQVCRFSQGIVNFRMATRRNNASLLKSAKYMTKELFHGRTHPKYQIIELYDTIQDVMMPEEVRELSDKHSSVTTSGNKSLGEDFDFILEEKNKQLKSWIPKGVPSDKIWLTVCRNNKVLEAIKEHSLRLFNVNSDKSGNRPLGIDDAITAYRVLLRRSDYLEKEGDHVSITGVALDEGLVDFLQIAIRKRIHMLKTEFLGLPFLSDSHEFRHPVPITPAEKEKHLSSSNLTVKQLQSKIEGILENIYDPFQYDYHKQMYQQEVRTKGKAKLLHFLTELEDVIDSLTTDTTGSVDEQLP